MNYSKIELIVIIILLYFFLPQRAYAYIDIGSGSYFFQFFLASIVGLIYTIKLFWLDIKTFLKIFSK